MTGRVVRWAVNVTVLGILVTLLLRLGAAPFLAGLQHLDLQGVLAALALTAVATVAAAWRWAVLGRAFGIRIPLRHAVPAYYRSQFLNSVLPGGVVGDVGRGLTNGGPGNDRVGGLRVAGWDRGTGQVVQLVLVAVVVLAVDSPFRAAVLGLVVAVPAVLLLMLVLARSSPWMAVRMRRLVRIIDAGRGSSLLAASVLVPVTIASAVATVAHASVFLVAASLTGATADPIRLLPLALVVQVAMTFPSGLGGWGPREGAAAAAFGAAGLGAANGVAAATAYGALALLAVLPGAGVLLVSRLRHRTRPIEAHPALARRKVGP